MTRQVEDTLLKQLKNPFDPKFIKWRVGATSQDKKSGIALAYIDSREVKKRLDDVMGITGWKDELIRVDKGFICNLYLKINDEWIPRSNAGEDSNMSPVKGGASDAFKRAASKWGIGHYLYYLPNVWVDIVPVGKSYGFTEQTRKNLANDLPDWALPGKVENWEDIASMAADLTSGEDSDQQFADMVISNTDLVRNAKTEEELEKVLENIPKGEQIIIVNEINAKRRDLSHESKIHSNNS